MFAPWPGMEIQAIRTVKPAETLYLVLYRMRMDQIKNHRNAQSMSGIYQLLQLIGGAKAGADSKKIRYLVSERTVIGMLLDSHQLNGVVSQARNPGQNVPAKRVEARHNGLFRAHTYMHFVDKRIAHFPGRFVAPPVRNGRSPYLGAEYLGFGILYATARICG